MTIKPYVMILAGAAFAMTAATPSAARTERIAHYDLPAQDLGVALRRVGQVAHVDILFSPGDVAGLTAPALRGDMTVTEAIDRLLSATSLSAKYANGSIVVRKRPEAAEMTSQNDIVVTGSRIRGAPPAAPVTTVTAADIRNAGQADLGEVARSLPINFGGGQNPGLNNSGGAANQNANVNGASTFNLRGVGPNATLTLLNGNRLSYSGTSAAIDVSTIPVAALDRVEIVADGASAIYGSDAVAGVVNIILKPDYSGASTSLRSGVSTDGGNFQQQADAVAGARWSSGGVIATYDFLRNTAIRAEDRSYTSTSNPDTTLYPEITRQSFLLSGHQSLGGNLTLSTDLVFKAGEMRSATGTTINRPITYQGNVIKRPFETFGIAPTVGIGLREGWSAKVSGFYGTDDTSGTTYQYTAGAFARSVIAKYDNAAKSIEASAQGPLFHLPGGDVRLAVGAGARRNDFLAVLPTLTIARHRDNVFGYAEAFVPLVAPEMDVPIVRRASLSGAVRIEDYSDSNRIATPKVGFIYAPFEALTFKASWGRSYKLPTLYQQYSGYATVLLAVSGYGSTFPANSTFIYALGANNRDQAERSENLTLTTELKPLRDLDLSVSYFHITYRDRVAPPLSSFTGALTNPLYADFVTLNPTATQINAIIANAGQGGLQNATASPYDPSRVIAILDARDRNISRQWYHGIDAMLRYRLEIGARKSLSLTAAATWLDSKQQLLAGQPITDLAGTIFNPARFKARGGGTYVTGAFSLSAYVNYVGGVVDNRRTLAVPIDPLTTLDLTGRLSLGRRIEVSVNALNLLNAKPQAIYTASTSDAPFDATNYAATGRFVGVMVTRTW